MEMTLQSYYEALPKAVAPKTEFVERIAKKCGVRTNTVRFWVKGITRPSNPEHLEILAEETGIEVEELFAAKQVL
jgi:transcriptional regulator with XRE-family HTH domain